MIRTFQGKSPMIDETAFIEETAVIVGEVTIGAHSSIWFQSVVRGDVHAISIGPRSNVQDLCVLHVTHGTYPLRMGGEVTVGHHVVLHGCTIADRVLIGMGAVIMDGATIGEDVIVGAGTLVTQRLVIPPNSLVLGAPAKVVRSLTDEERQRIKESADNYVRYATQYREGPATPRIGF